MKNIKYLFVAIVFIFSTSTAFCTEPGPVYDQYFINKVKGFQFGYSHRSQYEDTKGDKKLITTKDYSELRIKRLGFNIKLIQDLKYVEDSDGNPVSFMASIQSQGETINIQGEFLSPDKVHLTTVVNGDTKTEDVAVKKKIMFPYAIEQLFKDTNKSVVEYSTVDPSSGFKIVTIKAEKTGMDSLADDNIPGDFIKYKISLDILPNIENYEWHDNAGKVIKEKTSLLGLERIVANKDQITNDSQDVDMLSQSMIPVTTHFQDPFYLGQVNYKIDTKSKKPQDLFIIDNRQSVVQSRENTIFLKVKSEQESEGKYSYPVKSPAEYSEYLQSGPFINYSDQSIADQAKSIVSNETDAYKIAKTMEKWVFDAIDQKDYSVNFANSIEVMKSKEGDCTEHSILLASLLRSAGIPAKVVIGLIYTSTPEDAFGYHMWVKAYIGKWVSLDPSFPADSFSPIHIALGESALNNLSDKTDMIFDIAKSFSDLKIQILDFSTLENNIVGISLQKADETPEANSDESSDNTDVPVTNINLKGQAEDNADIPIKSITLKDDEYIPNISLEMKKKYKDEAVRSGLYNFSKGNIAQAVVDFEKASKLIPYNDDFSSIKMAIKLASLGFFNLADKELNNIKDAKIWQTQIESIKTIYFPGQIISPELEMSLASAASKINFQDNPSGAITSITSEPKYARYDYAHYLLAKAYLAQKQSVKAIDELNGAININPANLTYRLELAKIYKEKSDFKKARKEIEYILKQPIADKKFLELTNTELYWVLFAENRKDELKSQYYYAKYYETKGEYDTAISILNKLIKNNSEDSGIYQLLGDINLHLNQPTNAKQYYEKALSIDSKSVKALIGLGNLNKQAGKNKEALGYYQKAEKINSDNIALMLEIADCYKLLSQEELAYQYYTNILEIAPANYLANHNVALMYLNGEKIEKAQEYFKRALSINPNFPDSWLELAKLELAKKNYFLAKSYLDAVSYLEQNNSAQYYYYLGLIDKNNESLLSARANFKKALDINPDFAEAIKEYDNLK